MTNNINIINLSTNVYFIRDGFWHLNWLFSNMSSIFHLVFSLLIISKWHVLIYAFKTIHFILRDKLPKSYQPEIIDLEEYYWPFTEQFEDIFFYSRSSVSFLSLYVCLFVYCYYFISPHPWRCVLQKV